MRNRNTSTQTYSTIALRVLARGVFACCLLVSVLGNSNCRAQGDAKIPKEEEGTGVVELLGESLDPDIPFHDEKNNFVKFGQYFDGKRPIILSFNYSNCPNVCSIQLEKMAISLSRIDLDVEKDFQVISVSIDPNEQASRAREFKEKFTRFYNRPDFDDGWHFLVGDEADIRMLASECGVTYKYIPEQKLYSHPPVFLLISPEGKIVRYIYGLDYEPITVKRALVEAAEGKIGSSINRLSFLTGCYLYNPNSGTYTFQAIAIMRIGGAATVIGLCIGLVPYWLKRRSTKSQIDKSMNKDNDNEQPAQTINSSTAS